MNNQLNIEIGKEYPASELLEKINKRPELEVSLGHVIVQYEKEKKHEFYLSKERLKKLKELSIKVLLISTKPSYKNSALKLIEDKEIMEILEEVKKDNTKICILDKLDLAKINFNKEISEVITNINKALKAHRMPFKAFTHSEGIQIKYKEIKVKSK